VVRGVVGNGVLAGLLDFAEATVCAESTLLAGLAA
jgi:hypothetical protein